jgi:hypothetical protein
MNLPNGLRFRRKRRSSRLAANLTPYAVSVNDVGDRPNIIESEI